MTDKKLKHTPVAHYQIHKLRKPKFFGRVFFYTVIVVLTGYAFLLYSLSGK